MKWIGVAALAACVCGLIALAFGYPASKCALLDTYSSQQLKYVVGSYGDTVGRPDEFSSDRYSLTVLTHTSGETDPEMAHTSVRLSDANCYTGTGTTMFSSSYSDSPHYYPGDQGATICRSLLFMDFELALPVGATINNAELWLYSTAVIASCPCSLYVWFTQDPDDADWVTETSPNTTSSSDRFRHHSGRDYIDDCDDDSNPWDPLISARVAFESRGEGAYLYEPLGNHAAGWNAFDVTDHVAGVMAGTLNNYGWMLDSWGEAGGAFNPAAYWAPMGGDPGGSGSGHRKWEPFLIVEIESSLEPLE